MARREERVLELKFPSEMVHRQSKIVLQNLQFKITIDDIIAGRLVADNSRSLYAGFRMEIQVRSLGASLSSVTLSCEPVNKHAILDPGGDRRKLIGQVESSLKALLDAAESQLIVKDEENDSIAPSAPKSSDRRKLYQLISNYFNKEDIEALIFFLELNENEFSGSTGSELARELIVYSENNGIVEALKEELKKQNPVRYMEFFQE